MEVEFYSDKFFAVKKDDELDLSAIPALLRRRLNLFDKKVFIALQNSYDKNVENIILSSRYGEFERLVKLIEQYKFENEVSPSLFSASVHNYVLGQFCVLNNIKLPYFALSGGEKSFSSGLFYSVIQNKKNVIYVYEDNDIYCFRINKEKRGQKFILKKDIERNFEDSPYDILKKEESLFSGFRIRKIL